MSNKSVDQLVDDLSGLTVLEMSELKTALEDKWGVKAAAAAATVVAAAPAAEEAAEEATDFNISLDEFPADKKIAVIKVVREVTGFVLKEAKEAVESAPKVIKESVPKAEADEIKKKFEDIGAKVSLKGV